MVFRLPLIYFVVASTIVACKTRNKSEVKTDEAATSVAPGFDVNDVSILFRKTNTGMFYPNVQAREVWPKQAFNDLIMFAKDGRLPVVPGVPSPEFGQFTVPADYATLVEVYKATPGAALPGKDAHNYFKSQVAKDIADQINLDRVKCRSNSDKSMTCVDKHAKPNFQGYRSAIADINNWRIVAMRMDLCAGAHPSENAQCDVEFRMIAQPFGDYAPVVPDLNAPVVAGKPAKPATPDTSKPPTKMFDVSAHLLYKIGTLNLDTGGIVDDKGIPVVAYNEDTGQVEPLTAQVIISDLQKIKSASPVSTNGMPLGVHPGLKKETGGPLSDAIWKVIEKYSRSGKKNGKLGEGLTAVTSMHVAGPALFDSSVWVFFQGVIENGGWVPTPITGNSAIWSVRTDSVKGAGGKMFPPPMLQNRRDSLNTIFNYEAKDTLAADVANLPSFFDNPGRFGDPTLSVKGMQGSNQVVKVASSVRNTDCISCHMTSTRAFEWGVRSRDAEGNIQPSFYTPPVGTTAYLDPETIPRIDYSLRNFGYFLPPPIQFPNNVGLGIFNFGGPREDTPAIMTRVVNESAELVNLINSRFLNVPNPGFKCANENTAEALKRSNHLNFSQVFLDDAQDVIRRNKSSHAVVSDCLLYDSFKFPADQAFKRCTQLCMAGSTVMDSDVVESGKLVTCTAWIVQAKDGIPVMDSQKKVTRIPPTEYMGKPFKKRSEASKSAVDACKELLPVGAGDMAACYVSPEQCVVK